MSKPLNMRLTLVKKLVKKLTEACNRLGTCPEYTLPLTLVYPAPGGKKWTTS